MTVISRLNPEIKYKEVKTIDEEDVGYTSTVYELDLFTPESESNAEPESNTAPMTISVVIGKPKYVFSHKNHRYLF